MSDEVPTIMYWEGVPISELSREALEEAFKTMHHMQQDHMADLHKRRIGRAFSGGWPR